MHKPSRRRCAERRSATGGHRSFRRPGGKGRERQQLRQGWLLELLRRRPARWGLGLVCSAAAENRSGGRGSGLEDHLRLGRWRTGSAPRQLNAPLATPVRERLPPRQEAGHGRAGRRSDCCERHARAGVVRIPGRHRTRRARHRRPQERGLAQLDDAKRTGGVQPRLSRAEPDDRVHRRRARGSRARPAGRHNGRSGQLEAPARHRRVRLHWVRFHREYDVGGHPRNPGGGETPAAPVASAARGGARSGAACANARRRKGACRGDAHRVSRGERRGLGAGSRFRLRKVRLFQRPPTRRGDGPVSGGGRTGFE